MIQNATYKLMRCAVLLICVISAADVLAAPDEIMVYTDEMNDPGKFGLELHLNYSVKGAQTPEYPGQMAPHHVIQANPEFSYGINKNFDAGLYLPVALAPDGNSFINALRGRLKYIAPKTGNENFFYGLNVELSRDSIRVSESALGIELRPIVGYRDAKWLLSFNPILNVGLSDNVSHQAQFEPALKLTHRVGEKTHAGVEYYGMYGALDQMQPANQLSHTLYAVLDTDVQGMDINFGIGHGFVNVTDEWVLKGVISLPI